MTTAQFDSNWIDHDRRQETSGPSRLASDPALSQLLARSDDRLLRDAGLNREDILGLDGAWWASHRRFRSGWDL